jgi:hypothetical protein
MAVNSSYRVVKEYLDKHNLSYEGQMGRDCHFRFKIRYNNEVKVIGTSMHKGEWRSITNCLAQIRTFYKRHGLRLPHK